MKHKGLFLTCATVAAVALFTVPVSAQTSYRRANLVSGAGPNDGRCTVSVFVEGTTDVEIRGDRATLRDISGGPARWQRFECTGPLPYSAANVGLRAIEGNGRMTLSRDTHNGGVAVVRVDNAGRGDELYTFDLFWDYGRPSTAGTADREVTEDDAVHSCRAAVENRIRNDGYRYIRFGSISTDDRGPSEWVSGTATGDHAYGSDAFSFSCRVDNNDGQVRHLDVTRR